MKAAPTLALDKTKQRTVANKARKLRNKIKSGKISIKEDRKERKPRAETRGLVYVGHIPHGFYEDEMKKYFTQFGKVTKVKVCRSKNNGNSKGYGYVEFAHVEVAKIAAETMNNYIMFKKKLIAEYVPYEKRPTYIFQGKQSTPQKFSKQRKQARNAASKNQIIGKDTHIQQGKVRLTRLQKRLQKIRSYGIEYDMTPSDVPQDLVE